VDLGALGTCEAFAGLSGDELDAIVAVADRLEITAGGEIFAEGSEGESLYVILDGAVELRRSGQVVGELGPGDFFGEMSLFNRYIRVAQAVATADARLLGFRRQRLQPLVLRHHPAAVKVVQRLGAMTVERLQRVESLDAHVADEDPALPWPARSTSTGS
jgi:CRP-like cAMP-binding protein